MHFYILSLGQRLGRFSFGNIYACRKMAGRPRPRANTEIVPVQEIMPVADTLAEGLVLLLDFVPELATIEGTLTWMARRCLIRNSRQCVQYQVPCSKVAQPGVEQFIWQCPEC